MSTSILRFVLSVVVALGVTAMVPAEPVKGTEPEPPKDKATLCKHLHDEFQELLKADANPEPINEAARLLATTNQNTHWTNFVSAVTILRKQRSKAAIPLLMRYVIEHANYGASHISIPTYVETINILAGEKVAAVPEGGADRQNAADEAVMKLYVNWWQPNKNKLTTDLGKMPEDRLKFVVSELLRHSNREIAEAQRYSGAPGRLVSTEELYQGVTACLRDRRGHPLWWKEELDGRMTPILLSQAGYVKKPMGDPTAGSTRVSYGAIPLLAILHQQGQAPMLERIIADQEQNNATRLTCILAIHFAGADMDFKVVSTILETDTRLECRVLSLLALGLSDKNSAATPKLVAALNDKNREIRLAAIHALRSFAPKAALPTLTKVVQNGEPSELTRPAVELLGKIGGEEAAGTLAEHMGKLLKNGGKQNYEVSNVLRAFSEASGSNWIEVGAHTPAYYAERAQKAIDWWMGNQKKM